MLNSLANHGFLPHDGRAISQNITIAALADALNVDESLAEFLHSQALTTVLDPDGSNTFSLDDLSNHNILEHDASLRSVHRYLTTCSALPPIFPYLSCHCPILCLIPTRDLRD